MLTTGEKLTAGSVNINGGKMNFPAGSRIASSDKKAVENTGLTAIELSKWGTLPSVETLNVALAGEWDLPAGIAEATVKANATDGDKTLVNGLGASLTPSGADVYAKGYFEDLKPSKGNPLKITMGHTVCTATP